MYYIYTYKFVNVLILYTKWNERFIFIINNMLIFKKVFIIFDT